MWVRSLSLSLFPFQAVGSSNSDFYGADPMIDGNEMLYNEIGKFFPFAVSGKAGYQNASVTKGRFNIHLKN